MANRLAAETSPYLLQHADNPVDWSPWTPEAFERAAAEDRPVFLSVGYAACHWCHVMAHESFEDRATAEQLNAGFVPIKVDREERPDVDAIYMAAVQAMTGGGGWPMSVFLTPDGRPFFGGTYFPGEPRYGMPSFRQILDAISVAWRDRRDEIESAADALVAELRRQRAAVAGVATIGPAGAAADGADAESGETGTPRPPLLTPAGGATRLEPAGIETAIATLERDFDPTHAGWGGAPKFPQPAIVEFLIRRAGAGSGAMRQRALRMATRTLDAMADGGIHDQLGGGFHRYATDERWLVPHFEKMLYDNAQLARVYLHAYQATRNERYRRVAESTLDYMARELLTPEGLFAASQDADTAGVEGATYVWTRDELSEALAAGAPTESDDRPPVYTTEFAASASDRGDDSGPRDREIDLSPSPPAQLDGLVASAYGVNDVGNWEGRTILSRLRSDGELGAMYGLEPDEVARRLEAARAVLLRRREARAQPGRDDKAIAAWNGLALAAFADAIPVLERPADLAVAERAAAAILRHLRTPDGRLARSFRDSRTTGQGLLEDHADLAEGFLALYEATFEERWLGVARELMRVAGERFADPAGGWYDTADDHERLLLRPKEIQDGATPSGGAAAALVLLRLAELTGEGRQRADAERAIEAVQPFLPRHPLGFGAWLLALDFALAGPTEVAIAGDVAAADTRALLATARDGFRPYRVIAAGDPAESSVELLQARFRLDGRATAFVCREFACRQPVTEPHALAAQLLAE